MVLRKLDHKTEKIKWKNVRVSNGSEFQEGIAVEKDKLAEFLIIEGKTWTT